MWESFPKLQLIKRFKGEMLWLDSINLVEELSHRPCILKSVRKFFAGPFRKANTCSDSRSAIRQERGWKLFILLPRLLLFKNPRGGMLGKEKFAKRFNMFLDGAWSELLRLSRCSADDMVNSSRRRRRCQQIDPDTKRVEKALRLVQLGELSSARQASEGAELAPGNIATHRALTDASRRQPEPRDPLPRDIVDFSPVRELELEKTGLHVISVLPDEEQLLGHLE